MARAGSCELDAKSGATFDKILASFGKQKPVLDAFGKIGIKNIVEDQIHGGGDPMPIRKNAPVYAKWKAKHGGPDISLIFSNDLASSFRYKVKSKTAFVFSTVTEKTHGKHKGDDIVNSAAAASPYWKALLTGFAVRRLHSKIWYSIPKFDYNQFSSKSLGKMVKIGGKFLVDSFK